MKITYTSPNRSHHYPYASAMHKANVLYAFVAGFSRFSPRSPLPSIGALLKRRDLFQNLYLAGLKCRLPNSSIALLNRAANEWLDFHSFSFAKQSDVFIYYRTQGIGTVKRLRAAGHAVCCVMEEVNTHVDVCHQLMQQEYESLGLGKYTDKFADHSLRLFAYEQADKILCPSQFVVDSFINKGFNREKLICVPFGFPNINAFEEMRLKPQKDVFRVLFVGQVHFRKGLRYAIEAFGQLKHPKKQFIIVGPPMAVTGLEHMSIPAEVHFTGALKGAALEEQYRLASLFVLPSLEEGMALVQGEALSFGLPLLITHNTGGADLITNDIEGYIVPPANAEAIREKMQYLADNPQKLQAMRYAALEAAKKLGSWDDAVSKLIIALQSSIYQQSS